MHMCYKIFTPLGYGVLLAKKTFRTKIRGGLGYGSIQNLGPPTYVFLQPLKLATSNGALFKTLSKFAVNAVQQIDSAIISSLQRMPWIAVFSAGDETPSTSTMFWPMKAMHSRPVQWPLEKHGHLEWLITLTARVVSMSIWTWDGGVIQRQTSDVESQQGITRWRIAVKAAVDKNT